MKRREFITLLGGAAVWPTLARAQQPGAMPVIGFLHSGAPGPNAKRLAGFRKGSADAGLVEGQNNLKTAKALGLEPPAKLLALADEVIE